MRKKGLPLILAAVLLLTISPAVMGFAQTEVAMETKLLNVAKNQKVTSLGGTRNGMPDNVNDDNFESRWIGPTAGNSAKQEPTLTFDLQRRYPIESIIIFDHVSDGVTSTGRGRFAIYGSDKADFSDKTLLYEADIPTEELDTQFPAGSEYCITLPQKPAYRYIRYQGKDKGVFLNLKEIQIWAHVNATEISRGCQTYTTPNLQAASNTGDKAVDGKLNDDYYGCKSLPDYPGYFSTFTVDLGSAKHVGFVELYGRKKVQQNRDADSYFALLGSNEGTVTDFTKSATEGGAAYAAMSETDFKALGYTQIVRHPARLYAYTFTGNGNTTLASYPKFALTAEEKLVYDPYPKLTDEAPYAYTTMMNQESAYRYITHRKTYAGYMSQLAEFRAYALNPEAYELCNITADGVTVRFSDFNMDAASLTANTLQVLDASGNVVEGAIASVTLADNGADANVRFAAGKLSEGTAYTLAVSADVQNMYGMKAGAEEQLAFTLPTRYAVTNVHVSEFKADEASSFSFTINNNTAADKNVLAVVALYNGHKIVDAEQQKKTVAAGGAQDFAVQVQNSAATSMKVFLWDADTLTPISYR